MGVMLSTKEERPDPLTPIKSFAEKFAAEQLEKYVARLKLTDRPPNGAKEINDAIWGTVKVQPIEIIILDSPLIQRLRFIRQLGVVHWIYPGATHARFEHSLGVVFQIQQLISAINQSSPPGRVAIEPALAGLLRLCALVHDIGHGVFSHVSEHALVKLPSVTAARAAFVQQHKLEKVQLSEIIAYYIIGSKPFIDLLEVALTLTESNIRFDPSQGENARIISEKIQRAIIGSMIDENVPLIHEIISGPFDADKLDYYVRDAKLSGIPPTLDISRLTQKIETRFVPTAELPPKVMRLVSKGTKHHYIFGIKWSGSTILDELHLARVLLYSKIYRHKKVQAAESMVTCLVNAIASETEFSVEGVLNLLYNFGDDQIILSDAKNVLEAAGITSARQAMYEFVDTLLHKFRTRQLFSVAAALHSKYPSDPLRDDDNQVKGLMQLAQDVGNVNRSSNIKGEILKHVSGILEKKLPCTNEIETGELEFSLTISAKPPLGDTVEIDRAYIFQGDSFINYKQSSDMSQSAWINAYDFSAAFAYVFCPRELAEIAFIATERVVREQYGVVLPGFAQDLSKQSRERIASIKRELEESGWYEGVSLDIRPVPLRLEKGDIEPRIKKIAENLQKVDEPPVDNSSKSSTGIDERVRQWLAQFRSDDHISCALDMIESVRVLGRTDLTSALNAFVTANPKFKGATIAPIGTLKDSSAVQAYFAQDLRDIFPHTMTVEDACSARASAPIVFVDDFIGSGGQVSDILGNWFEDSEIARPDLAEQRLPFSKDQQEYLRSRPVGFVFSAGWEDGRSALMKACQKLGIDATIHIGMTEDKIPFAFENCGFGVSDELKEAFKVRCAEIGEQLMSGGASEAKSKTRALGYGNRSMLLVSGYNVPTQVLTCLWKAGTVDGIDWHPLLNRRTKV
jgi:deoxynucleoside triphosphate triphosphohydrolase SAMHD1